MRLFDAEARRRSKAVEAACWESMGYGCGVLVTIEPFSAVVHPDVPAGTIYQAATEEIRLAFVEGGPVVASDEPDQDAG